jgi:hypothetical protein
MPTSPYQTISVAQAGARGYQALTYACFPDEYYILNNVVKDMERYDTDYVLVHENVDRDAIAVYRKNLAISADE